MKTGFIGLGIMGSRMAKNLQNQGFELIVHNRTKKKAEELLALGALWADSPATVAAQSDVLITMLSTPEAVKTVALGKDGFLEHMAPGTLWVNCSTVNPSFTQELAQAAGEKQIRFLDAPVAGTKGPAGQGTLVFLLGGEAKDIEACTPLLEAMGSKSIHVGACGMGSAMKMLINLLLGQAMTAFSEAMVLGQAMGLSQEALFNTLLETPVSAPFLKNVRAKMEQENYEANFPLRLMQKDLHLACLTAYEHGVSLPTVNATKESFALAAQHGLANQDFSAIYHFLDPAKINDV